MILNNLLLGTTHPGYISSSDDPERKVTIGKSLTPVARDVYLLDAQTLMVVQRSASLKNGHYIFTGLNPDKHYLVMARDLKPSGTEQRYEPAAWDYVPPATELTVTEQQQMWQNRVDDAYQQLLDKG